VSAPPRRLADIDSELTEHYAAAVGAKAQRYEPSFGPSDVSAEEIIMAPARSRERRKHAAIEIVLASLPADTRRTLRLVYAGGTDTLEDGSGRATGLMTSREGRQDPLGLLRLALAPRWGHGSFVRLSLFQTRSLTAFGKRHPGREQSGAAVLDFLAAEAGKGQASESMLSALREDCESIRSEALRAYDVAFSAHAERAREARRQHDDDEQRRQDQDRAQRKVKAREARISGRIPQCLRMSDETRERLRAAALEVLAEVES
jgi:hypothetical protein